MAQFEGTLARKFDFGVVTTTTATTGAPNRRGALRLAPRGHGLTGPDKYHVLAHRRRQAQIAARRLLDLFEVD
jgi:hypothetical protein